MTSTPEGNQLSFSANSSVKHADSRLSTSKQQELKFRFESHAAEVLKSTEEKRRVNEQVQALRNRVRKLRELQDKRLKEINEFQAKTEVIETVRQRHSMVNYTQDISYRGSRKQQEMAELELKRQQLREQRERHREILRKSAEKVALQKHLIGQTTRIEVEKYEKQKKRDLDAVLAARRAVRDNVFFELKRGKEVQAERSQLNRSVAEESYLKRVRDNMTEKEQQLAMLRSLEEQEAELVQLISVTSSLHSSALSKLSTVAKLTS
jgi:hypothetical protein